MFRITAEGNKVDSFEMVWEIMYRYVNPEVSLAYPEQRICKDVPPNVRIWKHKRRCWERCITLNIRREPSESSLKKIIPL